MSSEDHFSSDVTEQFSALQVERDLLRLLIDCVPDIVFARDLEGHIIFANAMKQRMHGCKAEAELLGRTVFDLFSHDQAVGFEQENREIMEKGKALIDYKEVKNVIEGEERDYVETKLPLRHPSGKIVGLLIIQRDITRLKQSQQALLQEKSLLQTFFDNIPDHIYFKDRESRFVRVNQGFLHWAKRATEAGLLGQTDFDLFGPEHAKPAFQDEQEIMRSGRMIRDKIEKEVWKDGHVTWAATTKVPWRDAGGNVIGTFGVSRNVTDLVLTQKNLEESQQALIQQKALLQTFFDHVPDAIYFKDLEGKYVRVNQGFLGFYDGISEGEVLGKTDFDFYSAEFAGQARQDEQKIIQTGERIQNKIERGVWKDGRLTCVITTKMPWRNGEGKIIGTFGVSRDVTELMRAQQALEESENLFRSVWNHSKDCMRLTDGDGVIIAVNEACCALFRKKKPRDGRALLS